MSLLMLYQYIIKTRYILSSLCSENENSKVTFIPLDMEDSQKIKGYIWNDERKTRIDIQLSEQDVQNFCRHSNDITFRLHSNFSQAEYADKEAEFSKYFELFKKMLGKQCGQEVIIETMFFIDPVNIKLHYYGVTHNFDAEAFITIGFDNEFYLHTHNIKQKLLA